MFEKILLPAWQAAAPVMLIAAAVIPPSVIQVAAFAEESTYNSAARIDDWIKELSSPSFRTRENATRQLADAGPRAIAWLKVAVGSRDSECAWRAKSVLRILEIQRDTALLQGTWKYESAILSGKPEMDHTGGMLRLEGQTMTITRKDGSDPYGPMMFAIRAGQMPKQFTFVHNRDVIKGLYHVEKNRLTLCYPYDRNGPRPSKLATTSGDGMRLHVLSRVRP